MSYYPKPESNIGDKIKVVLELSIYTTEKN